MKSLRFVVFAILLAAGLFAGLHRVTSSSAAAPVPKQLLVVTHSAGYKHAVVKRPPSGKLSLAEQVIQRHGQQSGDYETSFLYTAEECRNLSPAQLQNYDGVFFYTTGNLPFSSETQAALIEFVHSGKGFIGAHSATDTFYAFPAYGEMIGGYFDGHPWHQQVTVKVEDPKHPSCSHLGESFEIRDEIYQFREPWSRDRVNVLLSLDPTSVDLNKKGVKRTDGDFALSWTRTHGQGRVFYTALGHGENVWNDKRFQQHLIGGIRWVLR